MLEFPGFVDWRAAACQVTSAWYLAPYKGQSHYFLNIFIWLPNKGAVPILGSDWGPGARARARLLLFAVGRPVSQFESFQS